MNVSRPFVVRPIGTTLLAIGLFLVGCVAYRYLPVIQEYLKEVKFPPVVTVRYEPKWAKYDTLEGQCLHTGTLPSIAYGGSFLCPEIQGRPAE